MKEEEKEILEKSDEEFLREYKAKLNGGEQENPNREEEKKQSAGREVKDMKLYDELQISPDATQN